MSEWIALYNTGARRRFEASDVESAAQVAGSRASIASVFSPPELDPDVRVVAILTIEEWETASARVGYRTPEEW